MLQQDKPDDYVIATGKEYSVKEFSKIDPICSKIQIGQDAIISKGSLKGSIVKICSLSSKERVSVFLSFLGSSRKVSISEKDIIF